MGFQVESIEKLNSYLEHVQKNGLMCREEMGTICCYAKQDKFWVNDPDGVQWEVYYFHEDAEFNDPKYKLEAKEACCASSEELITTEQTCC
jgi:hypothetical protein